MPVSAKVRWIFLGVLGLVCVSVAPPVQFTFAANKESSGVSNPLLAKYADALTAKGKLYAAAGDLETACTIFGRVMYFAPDHAVAGQFRNECARKLKAGNSAEKQQPDASKLRSTDEAICKVVGKDILTLAENAVKDKRYNDAAFWMREAAACCDPKAADEAVAKQAVALYKKMRIQLMAMNKAKAYWQVLSAAERLRLPPAKEGETDAEIDALVAEATKGVASQRKQRDADIEKAKTECPQRTTCGHALKYHIALPSDFSADNAARYPVVVSVTGSGAQWEPEIRAWAQHRSRGYIFISPVATSNTPKEEYPAIIKADDPTIKKLKFDSAGVHALLDDLENMFGADRTRYFVTGHSGGGNFTYYNILQHPLKWRAGAPRNPNFYGAPAYGDGDSYELAKKSVPVADIFFPVHIFTAANDEFKQSIGANPGIEPQTQDALAAFKKFKYVSIRRTEVPDCSHNESSKYFDKILDWFDTVQKGAHTSE